MPAFLAPGQSKSWHQGGSVFPLELHLGSCVPHGGCRVREAMSIFLQLAGHFITIPVCPSVPAATRLSHHALGAAPCPVCPPCWWCSWLLEIPKGFFYPLEEGLAHYSCSCQPLWHELQAAVGPSLSFPSSGNSPVPLPGALHSRSCQSQSHSPASFSGMRSGTFSRSTPLPLPHF